MDRGTGVWPIRLPAFADLVISGHGPVTDAVRQSTVGDSQRNRGSGNAEKGVAQNAPDAETVGSHIRVPLGVTGLPGIIAVEDEVRG